MYVLLLKNYLFQISQNILHGINKKATFNVLKNECSRKIHM